MLILFVVCIAICFLGLIDMVIEKQITIFENSGKKNELISWFIHIYKSIRNSWWVFLLAYIAYIGWDDLWPLFSLIYFVTFIIIYDEYKRGIINQKFITIVDSTAYLLPYIFVLYVIYMLNFNK